MYDKILVPLDGSDTARRGLREAIDLARQLKSQLVLLTVVDNFPTTVEMASVTAFNETRAILVAHGKTVLDEARKAVSEAGLPCETVLSEVMSQRPADSIVQEAGKHGCSLIVMGTHGRRGFNRLAMGSDAELVLREAPVPVLLVRSAAPKG